MTAIEFPLFIKLYDFILNEARLCDESNYLEWEKLWADDGHYWVPRGEGMDAEHHMSHINDNRTRIATRVRQLMSGSRHAQLPPSLMRRVLSGIEVREISTDTYSIAVNFILTELAQQAKVETRLWAGRTYYKLRQHAGELKMVQKKVVLINGDEPIPNLAFLI